ncbi:hypothetical protein UFOVP347_17 [uncultured Caudovirales phage]|uniref:Uncharacterized protein n=1 Tax=uncultured Caudovirales phage TaxID=2100421 RepID=A0A6J5LZL4_9CAUD|nr:hypothetical protein UFOVP347_17 [uncultured Caudovirales phage]
MVGPGLTPTDTANVLFQAWTRPFAIQSDFARLNAAVIAMAASDGLITTRLAAGLYGRRWLITPTGLRRLYVLWAEHGGQPETIEEPSDAE